ncbi:hypothetical protein Tco_0374692 [Tanacetum coccineum]
MKEGSGLAGIGLSKTIPIVRSSKELQGLDEPSSRKRNQRNKPRKNRSIVYTEDKYEDEDEYVDVDEVEDEDDHIHHQIRRDKKLTWDELLPQSEADKIGMICLNSQSINLSSTKDYLRVL